MSAVDALVAWLRSVLGRAVWIALPIDEAQLPGAVVMYSGTVPGDGLAGDVIERYKVGLVGRAVGAGGERRMDDVAEMDAALARALVSPQRGSGSWLDLTGTRSQDVEAGAVWDLAVTIA